MAKDIITKAEILGGEIDVRANFGQTVKVTVSPDPYMGDTEVTPSAETQVLATKKKFVQDDITVNPAPVETLSTTLNGTFTPSDGKVGFSKVDVNVVPDLRPLSVSENGSYHPDGFDGFSQVSVDVPIGGFPSYDGVVLPSEYQRVEYIESIGTQYINLPYGFEPADVVDIKASFNGIETDKSMVAPNRWNDNSNRFSVLYCQEFRGKFYFGVAFGVNPTGNTLLVQNAEVDTDLHRVVYRDFVFVMTDKGIAIGFGVSVFGTETYPLRLFYGYNANTSGKMSHFVHTKADGRKIALFACYRKSDGVIGMYDVENDVFYTNDGTGEFTKGQDI